jgi:ABC-type lipoprotein release transport system permease subunit
MVSLLVVATVAVSVATFTGADRSRTAFNRLRAATHATDVRIGFDGVRDDPAGAVRRVTALPNVTGATVSALMFASPDPEQYYPGYTMYASAPVGASHGAPFNTPVVTAGRAADQAQTQEVTVNAPFAHRVHAHVGSVITLHTMTDAFVQRLYGGEQPDKTDGPDVSVTVVGIVKSPADFSRYQGVVFLTGAFYDRYQRSMRVDHGVDTTFDAATRRRILQGRPPNLGEGLEVETSPFADTKATDDGLGTISVALRLLAAAMAIAGAAAVALAAVRLVRAVLGDHLALTAMGCTRRQLVETALLGSAPWLAAAVGIGLAVGAVASPRTLVGLARSADPLPNAIIVDRRILLASLIAAVVILTAVVAFAGVRSWAEAPARVRRVRRGLALRRPLPPILGVRYALGDAPDRAARSSRGAVVASILGVGLAVGALIVSASIQRLQVDPSLDGRGDNRVLDSGESTEALDRALPLMERDRRVSLVAAVHVLFGLKVAGDDVTGLAYDLRRGDLKPSLTQGRLPRGSDEVALGPSTLARVHKHVGDTVVVSTEDKRATYTITAATLFPEGDFEHDKGLALPVQAADRLLGNTHDASSIHQLVYQWNDGVDAKAADAGLRRQGYNLLLNDTGLRPAVSSNLNQVERLPRILAGFLGLVALATLGHAIGLTVRLRSKEFGTLRSLGATRAVSGGVVAFQSLAIVATAIAIGIPLGVAIGRLVWRSIAERAHLVVLAVIPGAWLLVTVAAASVAVIAITLPAARRATRLHPAQVLRAE